MAVALDKRSAILLGAVVVTAAAVAVALAIVRRADPDELLRSDDPADRREAISVLQGRRDTAQGMRRLAQATRHEDPAVACMALRAIAAGRDEDEPLETEGLQIVTAAAADPRPQVKHTALRVLEATTPPAPEDPTVPNVAAR